MAEPKKASKATDDLGADQVQEKTDAAEDKGYYGESPDPTPRENYTVAGVTADAPTPETDADAAAAVDAAQADLGEAPAPERKAE